MVFFECQVGQAQSVIHTGKYNHSARCVVTDRIGTINAHRATECSGGTIVVPVAAVVAIVAMGVIVNVVAMPAAAVAVVAAVVMTTVVAMSFALPAATAAVLAMVGCDGARSGGDVRDGAGCTGAGGNGVCDERHEAK